MKYFIKAIIYLLLAQTSGKLNGQNTAVNSRNIEISSYASGRQLSNYAPYYALENAPRTRHEFKAGYGLLSGAEVGFSFANAIGTAIGTGLGLVVGEVVSILVNGQSTNVTVTRIDTDDKFYGTVMAGYNYFPIRRISLGVQACYTPIVFKNTVYYSNNTRAVSRSSYNIFQFYGRLDFHYVLRPRFQMYSGIMGGLAYYPQDGGNTGWVPHLNLLGFRFGKKHALYTELGLGFSSTLSMGYSSRF